MAMRHDLLMSVQLVQSFGQLAQRNECRSIDVATGQIVGPPAEERVPTYNVVVDGEEIQVDVS